VRDSKPRRRPGSSSTRLPPLERRRSLPRENGA